MIQSSGLSVSTVGTVNLCYFFPGFLHPVYTNENQPISEKNGQSPANKSLGQTFPKLSYERSKLNPGDSGGAKLIRLLEHAA